mmetsp:Transcript_27225/g.64268  ORF Transcript_27225/g.64268 Transcript_27225/m.64268 type:complete len:326 (-) Transcript_27225:145-1122(-)
MSSFRLKCGLFLLLLVCASTFTDALETKRKNRLVRLRNDATTSPALRHRPLSFLELQPHLLVYSATVSSISPLVWGYQMAKLNPAVKTNIASILMMSLAVVPIQTMLKMFQLNVGTPITQKLNPWAAFAFMGMVQGGVTGQANVFFSRCFGIGNPQLLDAFRGYPLAGTKEIIAQGLPFAFSDLMEKKLLDPLLPSKIFSPTFKSAVALFSTSALGTVISQIGHNMQMTMVSNPALSYSAAAKQLWLSNGAGMFFSGAATRGGLMLLVNVLNECILKRAWQGVEEPLPGSKRHARSPIMVSPAPRVPDKFKCEDRWCKERTASAA